MMSDSLHTKIVDTDRAPASMQPTPAANEYLKTKVMTASPQELRLMLYDGAIKYCHQAMNAIEAEDLEESYSCLMRAQKIVLELSISLNHEVATDLCDKLAALYTYIYRLLVDANLAKDEKYVAEALRLLKYEKKTWQMLIDKCAFEGGSIHKVDQDGVEKDRPGMNHKLPKIA